MQTRDQCADGPLSKLRTITTDRIEQSLGLSYLVNLPTCELTSGVFVVHVNPTI